jgi:HJR/Mrr/RecB family endonuclease
MPIYNRHWEESKINWKIEGIRAIPFLLIILVFLVIPDWKIFYAISLDVGIVALATLMGHLARKWLMPYLSLKDCCKEVLQENNIAAALVLLAQILLVCTIIVTLSLSIGRGPY